MERKRVTHHLGTVTTSKLYRLGVKDMVIQQIVRHANVSATATYYIKTAAYVRRAMTNLEDLNFALLPTEILKLNALFKPTLVTHSTSTLRIGKSLLQFS